MTDGIIQNLFNECYKKLVMNNELIFYNNIWVNPIDLIKRLEHELIVDIKKNAYWLSKDNYNIVFLNTLIGDNQE